MVRYSLFKTISIGDHNLQQKKEIVLNLEYSKDTRKIYYSQQTRVRALVDEKLRQNIKDRGMLA